MGTSSQTEGRSGQSEVTVILQPTGTAAAPVPPPAGAATALPPPPHLPHQCRPAVLLVPPPLEGKGDVAVPPLTKLGVAAAATVPTGIAVIVVRRAGTGGGAAQTDQVATRKIAAIPGSAGAAGVDQGQERETGAEPGPEIATAETEIRKGKGAGKAEMAATAVAANVNRRPQAKMLRGGGKGVTALRKTRKRRIRIGRKSLIKRKKSQKTKIRTREAL